MMTHPSKQLQTYICTFGNLYPNVVIFPLTHNLRCPRLESPFVYLRRDEISTTGNQKEGLRTDAKYRSNVEEKRKQCVCIRGKPEPRTYIQVFSPVHIHLCSFVRLLTTLVWLRAIVELIRDTLNRGSNDNDDKSK